MPIEHVTRGVSFDNLYVEVSIYRYICDDCGRRQAFHDVPVPYNEPAPTPTSLGWQLLHAFDDCEEGARCPRCIQERAERDAKRAAAALPPPPEKAPSAKDEK